MSTCDDSKNDLPAMPLSYEPPVGGVDPNGWIRIDLRSRNPLPKVPYCCVCLAPEHSTWTPRFHGPVHVTITICKQCRARYERRLSRAVLVLLCALATALAVIYFCFTPDRSISSMADAIFYAGVLCILALVPIRAFAYPIQFGFWIAGMRTIRIRFRNPQYVKYFGRPPAAPALPLRIPPRPDHK